MEGLGQTTAQRDYKHISSKGVHRKAKTIAKLVFST